MKHTQKQIAQAKTIEQQLDLILKIQQDRKLLKRQNKTLNQKYLKLTQTFKKYTHTLKLQQSTMTESLNNTNSKQIQVQTEQLNTLDRGCQIDLIIQQQNYNNLNTTSKLTEAMSFLKAIDTTSIHNNMSRVHEQDYEFGKSSNILQNETLKRVQNEGLKQGKDGHNQIGNKGYSSNNNNSQQVALQIVKISKQMATLKRQLKQTDTRLKQRQKQLKQTKKCLQTKSQALQKTRKQFNQLSQLLNTDKYKSIRNLQVQNEKLRMRVGRINEQSGVIQSIKEMLQRVTEEYNGYREEKERKTGSLMKEVKEKDRLMEQLQMKLGECRNELELYKG